VISWFLKENTWTILFKIKIRKPRKSMKRLQIVIIVITKQLPGFPFEDQKGIRRREIEGKYGRKDED
jgi:hypothetical protein